MGCAQWTYENLTLKSSLDSKFCIDAEGGHGYAPLWSKIFIGYCNGSPSQRWHVINDYFEGREHHHLCLIKGIRNEKNVPPSDLYCMTDSVNEHVHAEPWTSNEDVDGYIDTQFFNIELKTVGFIV